MNRNRGITLIALVITIIILLILAGISIRMLSGDNSIINQAGNAKTQTDIAHEKEILEQATIIAMGKSKYGNVEKQYLDPELNKYLEVNSTEEMEDSILVTFKSNRIYVVDVDGNIIEPTDRNEINIGDYINYTPSVASTTVYDKSKLTNIYTGSYSNTSDIKQDVLNWRVLRIYIDGSIDLIGDITNDKVAFSDFRGYNNGVYLMNDICKTLYSNGRMEARSINLEDLEYWLKKTANGLSARDNYIESSSGIKYGESKTYTTNNIYPILFKTQKNESDSNILLTENISERNGDLTVKQTYYYLNIDNANYDAGAQILSDKLNKNYWVATRCSMCKSNYASFGLCYVGNQIFGSGVGRSSEIGSYSGYGVSPMSIRPVVHLKSNVQIIPKAGTTSEPHEITDYST